MEDAQQPLDRVEQRGQVKPRQQHHARQPGDVEQPGPEVMRPAPQLIDRIRRRGKRLAQPCQHRVTQITRVRDVAVQRHRRDPDRARHRPNPDGVDARPGEPGGSLRSTRSRGPRSRSQREYTPVYACRHRSLSVFVSCVYGRRRPRRKPSNSARAVGGPDVAIPSCESTAYASSGPSKRVHRERGRLLDQLPVRLIGRDQFTQRQLRCGRLLDQIRELGVASDLEDDHQRKRSVGAEGGAVALQHREQVRFEVTGRGLQRGPGLRRGRGGSRLGQDGPCSQSGETASPR